MKASEASVVLKQYILSKSVDYFRDKGRSRVDETKTQSQMLREWLNLFENNPDMTIGSIMRYNVNRDFNCL